MMPVSKSSPNQVKSTTLSCSKLHLRVIKLAYSTNNLKTYKCEWAMFYFAHDEPQIDGALKVRKPYTQVIISWPSAPATCEKDKLPLGTCCFHGRIIIEVIKPRDSNYSIGTCFSDKTSSLGWAASTQTSISSPIREPNKIPAEAWIPSCKQKPTNENLFWFNTTTPQGALLARVVIILADKDSSLTADTRHLTVKTTTFSANIKQTSEVSKIEHFSRRASYPIYAWTSAGMSLDRNIEMEHWSWFSNVGKWKWASFKQNKNS